MGKSQAIEPRGLPFCPVVGVTSAEIALFLAAASSPARIARFAELLGWTLANSDAQT